MKTANDDGPIGQQSPEEDPLQAIYDAYLEKKMRGTTLGQNIIGHGPKPSPGALTVIQGGAKTK